MASANYYLCDVCGCKTFYDANLSYGDFWERNANRVTGHPWPDDNVGFMVVICRDCAKTHHVTITRFQENPNG